MSSLVEHKKYLENPVVADRMKSMIPATISHLLPPERIIRSMIGMIGKSHTIAECTPESIARFCLACAELGLQPGPMGHIYAVPYKREITPIVGYRGLIMLARRSGEIDSISSYLIHENDEYDIRFGDSPGIEHRPLINGDRGAIVAAYCVAAFKGGSGKHVELMLRSDIESVRGSSRAKSGPWFTHYGEMSRKTVVRRAAKYWPLSIDTQWSISRIDEIEGYGETHVEVEPKPVKNVSGKLAGTKLIANALGVHDGVDE